MKKVMSVVLCIVFVACAVCGCSGAASQKFPQKFSFQYGGKEITIGDNIDKAVEYLGEPEFTTDPDEYDCVLWGYDGVTIKQLDSTIISISISDSQMYQICGIHCGDSHESVVKRLQKLSDKVSDSDDSTMFTAKMSDDATIDESIDMNVPYNESIVVTADPDELWHYGEVSVMYDDNDKVEYISTSILIESTFMPSEETSNDTESSSQAAASWSIDDFLMWNEDDECEYSSNLMWTSVSEAEKELGPLHTYRGIKIGDTTEKLLENYDFSMSDVYFDEDTDTTNAGTAYMEKYPSLEDRIRHTDEIPADSYLMIVTWCSYNSDTRKLTMMQGDGTGGVSLYVDGVDVSLTDGVFSVAFGLNQGKVAEILYYGQVPQGEADDGTVSSETDTAETSSESTQNTFLLNLPVTEYSMSNGTRASVIVGKEVLKLSTEEEFVSFVDEKIEGKDYNWFTIDLMDGTGLVFAGCNTTVFDYGEIDKDGALLKSIHTYVRSGDSYELVEQ